MFQLSGTVPTRFRGCRSRIFYQNLPLYLFNKLKPNNMNNSIVDVIIVGAGFAGLSTSYYLKKQGVEHIVLERGKAGESWRSQRWESFRLNSPNKLNTLPGADYKGNDPDGFAQLEDFVSSIEEYVKTHQLPVSENTIVLSVEKNDQSGFFTVTYSKNNRISQYQCSQVIIASGSMSERKVPLFAGKISPSIKQLHTSEYRNAASLAEGNVLVIGGGQSGCQVAEDLADTGRKVYLSTSMVSRIPRRYRGKDIMDWLSMIKFFDAMPEEITDPQMLNSKPPHLTGIGGGRTISLQSLAKKGVTILGRLESADEKNIVLQPNAAMHVRYADGFSAKVKEMIDGFIANLKIEAPLPEADPEDMPDTDASCANPATSLNLAEHNITSVIWTTGFSGNYNYIKLPVLDQDGNPKHKHGVAEVEGVYFLGLPWLRKRKSIILFGIKEDAEFIAEKVYQNSRKNKTVVA
jgi:putative flavoprotein involved in K+ transport